jgi:predicted permease
MTSWVRVLRSLRSLVRRGRVTREIDEELRLHLERRTAENVAAGMSRETAAREARKRFGNLYSVREECRDVRGASLGDALVQDVRYGARGLLNSPGFTIVAVLSLGLGIGATTTVFSLANAVLLRPLPVENADSLVTTHKPDPSSSGFHAVSYLDYVDYRDHAGVFSELLAWSERPISLNLGDQAEQAYSALVSGNYFSVLGVQPAVGRFFTAEEDRTPGAHPVVVISFPLWRGRFGGDLSIIGQTLKINAHTFTIVGVTPREFTSTYNVFAPALYVPLMMQAEILSRPDLFVSRGSRYLKLTGRLAPGVSREQAEAALTVLDRRLEQADPEWRAEENPQRPSLGIELVPVGAFPPDIRLAMLGGVGLLLAIVGCTLLIASANVAGLLLARATVRQREMAMRLALGATRRRLIRQLLTESCLLFCMAGALGVGLTVCLLRLLSTLALPLAVPFAVDASIDGRVLGFTLSLALLTGIVFGLAPAFEAARVDLHTAMKDAPAAQGFKRSRLRQAFVVGQIALASLLLISGGLVARVVRHAKTLYPGREPETVLTARFDPSPLGYDVVRAQEVYRQLTERVATLPGVETVSLARQLTVGPGYSTTSVGLEGVEDDVPVECNTVAPQYFRTVGIHLLEGRDFTAMDREAAPRVVIINAAMARRFWPAASALGQRLRLSESGWAEIVGVVEDGRYRIAGQAPPPFVYFPYRQSLSDDSPMTLVWRQRGDAASALATVRREVQAVDPDLPLHAPMTLSDAVRQTALPWRAAGALIQGFGLVGLSLALLGIYGLVSYTFRQRTHEIGIRVALGAQRREIIRLVLHDGAKLAVIGVGAGVALAVAVAQAGTDLLFGLGASDLATYLGAALLLVVVVLVGCWVPARRAARVDPMTALRQY